MCLSNIHGRYDGSGEKVYKGYVVVHKVNDEYFPVLQNRTSVILAEWYRNENENIMDGYHQDPHSYKVGWHVWKLLRDARAWACSGEFIVLVEAKGPLALGNQSICTLHTVRYGKVGVFRWRRIIKEVGSHSRSRWRRIILQRQAHHHRYTRESL